MGIKTSSSSNEKWGMGLLLVFFSDDYSSEPTPIFNNNNKSSKKNSSSNLILTKTQSTLSICALLVFITLLLFTLSSFEPTISHHQILPPRRILKSSSSSLPQKVVQNPDQQSQIGARNRSFFSNWVPGIWSDKILHRPNKTGKKGSSDSHALQGMGKLYLRGTKAMNDLIVVHVMDDDGDDNDNAKADNRIRMFLRLLHRSGLTSRADTVFIFGSKTESSVLNEVIQSENESFLQLVRRYGKFNQSGEASSASFDIRQFMKTVKDSGESIWGKKGKTNYSYSNIGKNNNDSLVETGFTRYGSVVGFDTHELDPENALAGFFDRVPVNLRRWSCYPMLLGRVRRNYKHIVLIDMKKVLLLGDPLGRIRTQRAESVFLYINPTSKHGRKNSEKSPQVNPAVIIGGSRGVRRLSNFMLTEIVRAAMQKNKGKHVISESCILNQLVRNEFLLKDQVNLIVSTESIPESSSHTEWTRNSGLKHALIQRGSNDIDNVIRKHVCSFKVESSVYRDCGEVKTSKNLLL